jgi:hypothetical protein
MVFLLRKAGWYANPPLLNLLFLFGIMASSYFVLTRCIAGNS